MFMAENKIKSGVLVGSIIGALVSSIWFHSFILSLIFCILEANAVALYFCNTFPIGNAANEGMQDIQNQVVASAVKSQVKNFLK